MNNYIAIGVSKIDKIWHGHFGVSPYFIIYNRDGDLIGKRINPHGVGQGYKEKESNNQPFLIKDILHDCNVFVGKKMGKASMQKLEKGLGIETILTKDIEPKEIVNTILKK